MTPRRPLIPILAALMFVGIAQAGEFSLGGAHLLAQNTAAQVDVNVNFTDRPRPMRETSEGGDETTTRPARAMRGADDAAAPMPAERPAKAVTPAAKTPDAASATSDSPHGVSISPATTIRRPSYRWQSLVPGTIK